MIGENYISTMDENIVIRMRFIYDSYPNEINEKEFVFLLSPDFFEQYNREVNLRIRSENDNDVRGTLFFRGIEVKKINDHTSMKRIVLTPIKNLNYEI